MMLEREISRHVGLDAFRGLTLPPPHGRRRARHARGRETTWGGDVKECKWTERMGGGWTGSSGWYRTGGTEQGAKLTNGRETQETSITSQQRGRAPHDCPGSLAGRWSRCMNSAVAMLRPTANFVRYYIHWTDTLRASCGLNCGRVAAPTRRVQSSPTAGAASGVGSAGLGALGGVG